MTIKLWTALALAGCLGAQEMPLSLADAVSRGVRTNIEVLVTETSRDVALGADKVALAALLPNLSVSVSESARQTNLAAFGFTGLAAGFSGFKPIVGPFALFDARAALNMSLLDLSARYARRAATADTSTTREAIDDARDTIASMVADVYYQTVALESRMRVTEAQRTTSERLLQQAQDQKNAGVVAGIDVLRAQVQLQIDEQRVISTRNEWEKHKLQLANAIGLPLSQPIRLTDTMVVPNPAGVTVDEAYQEALKGRADYRAYESRVHAAELRVQSARAQRLPTVGVQADYGLLGQTAIQNHGTFSVTAGVSVPVYEGGRISGETMEADARLREQRARQKDLANHIELDVRSALLDVDSAILRAAAARTATGLADRQLEQAQDRFAAGVTDNLEVVQSQNAVAVAQDNLIGSLFELQLAKAALARAMGGTEKNLQRFLIGRSN